MLYLIEKTINGEPVGVFAEDGSTSFAPDRSNLEGLGKAIVSAKGTQVPWIEFVDQKTHATDHRLFWDSRESSLSADDLLSQVIQEYQKS